MPAGLQVFSPQGNLWVDTSSNLARWYGEIETIDPNKTVYVGDTVPLEAVIFTYSMSPNWTSPMTMPDGYEMSCPMVLRAQPNQSTRNIYISFVFQDFANPYGQIAYGAL